MHNALYYPSISLSNPTWVKSMAMFYDSIYRIVPNNIIPDDDESLQELLEDSAIGRAIDPLNYSKEASQDFLSGVEHWTADALIPNDDNETINISRIHKDKIDNRVRALFEELGYERNQDWLDVPTGLASNYMLFLAKEIAKKNNLKLITNEWAPWTATTYFNLDGMVDETIQAYEADAKHVYDPYSLYSFIINEITPINIDEIPSYKIVEFREQRKDEIKNFRNMILNLYEELQNVDEVLIKSDIIQNKIKELERAKTDYKKSADMFKIAGWGGTMMLGFPALTELGKVLAIPHASTVSIAATLAIGGLFNIQNTKSQLRKMKRENPISCLIDLENRFKKYTYIPGGGDINYHAYNCMQEYVED